jgi:hypothetical protein
VPGRSAKSASPSRRRVAVGSFTSRTRFIHPSRVTTTWRDGNTSTVTQYETGVVNAVEFKNGQIVLPQVVIQIQEHKVVPIYAADFLNKPEYPVPAWSDRK